MPEGADETQIAANSDRDVLVMLDLHIDTSMIEQGVAREVVNRYQKLRKKAGLTVTDSIELYYELPETEINPLFEKALASQREYLKQALGSPVMPLKEKPIGAAVLFRENQLIKAEDGNISYVAMITPTTIAPEPDAFADRDLLEDATLYLASRDRSKLLAEISNKGPAVHLSTDGRMDTCLQEVS